MAAGHRPTPVTLYLITLCCVGLSACEGEPPAKGPPVPTAVAPAPGAEPAPSPRLPAVAGPMAPSFARVEGALDAAATQLTDTATCARCHPAQAREWGESVHAFASFSNPLYRLAFDAFAERQGDEAARFCGGCHDPALLLTGGLSFPIPAEDPRAHTGVSCGLCHGVGSVSADGNGSWTLKAEPIPLPLPGDDASLARHKARVGVAASAGPTLCVSCHRGFLGEGTGHPIHLVGLDEYGPWHRSGYDGSRAARIDRVERQDCRGCHMPVAEDGHHSHRFAGGHSTLAAMIGAPAQQAAVEARLQGIVQLEIVPLEIRGEGVRAATVGPGAATGDTGAATAASGATPAGPVAFDVVIYNAGVGHRFPGGALDLRDTWLEVEAVAADGRILAAAGARHAATGADPLAHRLHALVTDDQGVEVMNHGVARFRTPAYVHAVGPRDAGAARYRWTPPAGDLHGAGPVTLRARLNHRRLNVPFAKDACAAASGPQGAAFIDGARQHRGTTVDPCAPQPIVALATASITLPPGDQAPALSWQTLLRHGQALEHQVQERLDEANHSLQAALERAPPEDAAAQAAIRVELARLAGRQGRTADALALLDQAEALTPDHPAVAAVRAEALARVWRWEAAADAWQRAVEGAPGDDRLWAGLAVARASAGDLPGALDAARAGLALEPRDPQLLRSQMLALGRLAPGSEEAAAAANTWARFRPDDDANAIRMRCVDGSEGCERGRAPIPEYELSRPP